MTICFPSGGYPRMSQLFGYVPPDGNQLRKTAKTKMRRMPVKNVGSEKLVSELTTEKLSMDEPRFLDTRTPDTVPTIMPIKVHVPSKSRVLASLPELTI